MPRVVRLSPCVLPFVLASALGAGCTRSTAASFVPVLDVGLRVSRTAAAAQRVTDRDARALVAEVHVWLSFRPHSPAASLPTVGEASGLTLQAACDEGDAACLDEAAESEPELAPLREDVP